MKYSKAPLPVDRNDPVSVDRFREVIRTHECEARGCPYCLIRDWVNELEAGIKTDQKKSNEGEKDGGLV